MQEEMIDFDSNLREEVCEPEAIYTANKELNLAWDIIENTGCNLFLTGRAGTGKTTFLKKLRDTGSKRMVVLAPTGVAAINASGITLHSFFNLPLSPYLPGRGFVGGEKRYLSMNPSKRRLIASLSLIVIDEVSMVRPDILDAIDNILKRLRHSSLPFGGVQLLLIGDLRQLPPVVTDAEWQLLKEYYDSPYFFESRALREAGYLSVELSVVYRQTDQKFLEILNQIRDGKAGQDILRQLNTRYKGSDVIENTSGIIRLTTHNNRAAIINNSRLASLPGEQFTFEAVIRGNFPESSYPADATLRLKEGAQVMFVKNDIGVNRKFYNGLIGTVETLTDECIKVRIPDSGDLIEVAQAEWENIRYVVDDSTGAIKQQTEGTFNQFPLQLAWAITIHKSQGLTFDKAVIDALYSFAPGQTYVALSRCRSLDGLYLDHPIPMQAVITDQGVNDFVNFCENNTPDSERIESLKEMYLFQLFRELFDFERLKRSYQEFSRYAEEYLEPLYPEAGKILKYIKLKMQRDLCDVAIKFTLRWNAASFTTELSRKDSELKERIKSGAKYFLNNLLEIKEMLEFLPKEIENQGYADRLDNLFDNLFYHLHLKRLLFYYFKEETFSVNAFQEAYSQAILWIEQPNRKEKKIKKTPKVEKKLKEKKEKKPKGYSTFETLRLFKEGKSIEQIAIDRDLKESTIASHIIELIGLERIKIEDVVNPETVWRVRKALQENPDKSSLEVIDIINSESGREKIPRHIFNICRLAQLPKGE